MYKIEGKILYQRVKASKGWPKFMRMWKMSPKFHILQHICEHQSWFNPRMIWCYGDEDLQHLVQEVALSCHPTTTAHMTLYKWGVCNFTECITDHVVAPVRE